MQSKRIIPITQFDKGQVTKIFDRVKTEGELIVMKDDVPIAVIVSVGEYQRLCEIEESYRLLILADSKFRDFLATEPVNDDFGAEILDSRKSEK